MVGADDVESDVALELPQSQGRMALGVVVAQLLFVAERCSGQEMQPPHLRADQALDMTAETRLTRWPPLDRDAGVLASSLEGPAAEVRAIVDVHRVRQAGDGPRLRYLAFPQPCRFVEHGV